MPPSTRFHLRAVLDEVPLSVLPAVATELEEDDGARGEVHLGRAQDALDHAVLVELARRVLQERAAVRVEHDGDRDAVELDPHR